MKTLLEVFNQFLNQIDYKEMHAAHMRAKVNMTLAQAKF